MYIDASTFTVVGCLHTRANTMLTLDLRHHRPACFLPSVIDIDVVLQSTSLIQYSNPSPQCQRSPLFLLFDVQQRQRGFLCLLLIPIERAIHHNPCTILTLTWSPSSSPFSTSSEDLKKIPNHLVEIPIPVLDINNQPVCYQLSVSI